MIAPEVLLTRFVATRPRYETPQAKSLAWLSAAHAAAEASRNQLGPCERERFEAKVRDTLRRCGCTPEHIRTRGQSVVDVDAEPRDLEPDPRSAGCEARTEKFAEIVDAYFEQAYADDTRGPDELIHVTCTGYLAPSGAQKLVARRGWGAATRVTHAYHMGCYAAIPAVRIACGSIATGDRRVDIAHTELCSLHLDPSDHSISQLVVHSLFADGLIRYSAVVDPRATGLRVLGWHERVLPGSSDAMTWRVGDRGMRMTLARDVPDRIAAALRAVMIALLERAGRPLHGLATSVFAIHPGGPKIIDRVRDVLELSEAQVAASRRVLLDHGNMSSATLPHIWMRLLDDPAVPPGTLIPSVAFGPGLTVCAALLEKR